MNKAMIFCGVFLVLNLGFFTFDFVTGFFLAALCHFIAIILVTFVLSLK